MKNNNEEEGKTIIVCVMLKNIIAICAFVALAIFFKKWWIALFSALFYSGLSYNKKEDKEEK